MNLSDLANIVEIFGALAIMELARSFEDREFTEAYRLIADLDDGLTADQLNALGDDYVSAALRVGFKFETIRFCLNGSSGWRNILKREARLFVTRPIRLTGTGMNHVEPRRHE